jgi:hypothetical protein
MSELDPPVAAPGVESGSTRPPAQVLGVKLETSGPALEPLLAEAAAKADLVLSKSDPKLLKKRLGEITAGLGPAARIFCAGPVCIPEVGDFRFEPEIITPTRFVWRRLIFAPFAAIILVFWLAQTTRLIRLPVRVHLLGGFGYILAMGAIGSIMWAWRTTVRPSYVRLAPGMVQVLEYRLRNSKPTIRSYPMLPGTLVVVRQDIKGRRPLSVQLLRGDQADILPVSQMRNPDDAMQRIW